MGHSLPRLIAAAVLTLPLAGLSKVPPILAWMIALGFVTFLTYGMDKRAAKRKASRIPNATMHTLALSGGIVGAWMGRETFKHKTKPATYDFVLSASTVLWIVLVWIVLDP